MHNARHPRAHGPAIQFGPLKLAAAFRAAHNADRHPPQRPFRGAIIMASIREVKQQLDEGRDDVAEAANETAQEAAGELHRLGAKLRENGAELEDELRDAGERFAEGARTLRDAAVEQVREHPLAAFGIAFAAGYVASRLMRRRD
jgi:ElaB/YqjD/DUF883 family membrane-anchored ribosome-binding protein